MQKEKSRTQSAHFLRTLRTRRFWRAYSRLFFLFFFGSIIGFFLEGGWSILLFGRWENHSATLWGPFCIVYGFGAAAVYSLSKRLAERSAFLQFCAFAFLGSAVELLASLAQEGLFGSSSWNYSNHILHLGGRISLWMSLLWGCLGVLFSHLLFPPLLRFFQRLRTASAKPLCVLLSVFMLCNLLVTAAAILRWRARKDATPPANAAEAVLDRHYPDEYMEGVFGNMQFLK